MNKLLLIHGPNLNMLGLRQPNIYGYKKLTQINDEISMACKQQGYDLVIKQSNSEGEIIDFIQKNYKNTDIAIFNPAAYSHTSIAIYDVLLATQLKFIEVHISNIHNREIFREKSLFSAIAVGTISGFGSDSYSIALAAARMYLAKNQQPKEKI